LTEFKSYIYGTSIDKHPVYNDGKGENQLDVTLTVGKSKSARHVSGNDFAHPQEH